MANQLYGKVRNESRPKNPAGIKRLRKNLGVRPRSCRLGLRARLVLRTLHLSGTLVESPGHKQKWELKAASIHIYGTCPAEDYPLQKKRHSFEFLRTIAHLRPRTNTQGAVTRVRSHWPLPPINFFIQKAFSIFKRLSSPLLMRRRRETISRHDTRSQ